MRKEDQRFQNLSEFLFDKIAEKILSGKYTVGQKLVENDIMDEYSVSKSPVREALQSLMKVGLIEYRPRRGCYVKTVAARDVVNHYIVRTSIEGLAAGLAYRESGKETAAELRSYYSQMGEAAARNDQRAFLDSHDQFHEFFADRSGNEILADFCSSLRMQNIRYRLQFLNIDLNFDFHTHDELLARFEAHDVTPERYQALMEEHIRTGLDNFRSSYGSGKA